MDKIEILPFLSPFGEMDQIWPFSSKIVKINWLDLKVI